MGVVDINATGGADVDALRQERNPDELRGEEEKGPTAAPPRQYRREPGSTSQASWAKHYSPHADHCFELEASYEIFEL